MGRELSSTLSIAFDNETPCCIGDRCVILIRNKFIEFARYCNTEVLPIICTWTDVSALAIERHATPNSTQTGGVLLVVLFFFYCEKDVSCKIVSFHNNTISMKETLHLFLSCLLQILQIINCTSHEGQQLTSIEVRSSYHRNVRLGEILAG